MLSLCFSVHKKLYYKLFHCLSQYENNPKNHHSLNTTVSMTMSSDKRFILVPLFKKKILLQGQLNTIYY